MMADILQRLNGRTCFLPIVEPFLGSGIRSRTLKVVKTIPYPTPGNLYLEVSMSCRLLVFVYESLQEGCN